MTKINDIDDNDYVMCMECENDFLDEDITYCKKCDRPYCHECYVEHNRKLECDE